MTDYTYILSKAYPNKAWTMEGDAYEGLRWLDDSPKPSQEELDNAYISFKAANDYKTHRLNEYPVLADQLDDIFHNGIEGWRQTIQAVKDKFPKPGTK